jgi:hypothetical protein
MIKIEEEEKKFGKENIYRESERETWLENCRCDIKLQNHIFCN